MSEPELDDLPRDVLLDRARALRTVLRISEAMAQGGNVEDLSRRFVLAVAEYTRFPAVVVLRYAVEKDGFEIVSQHGFDESKFGPPELLPMDGSLTGLAAQRGTLLSTEDIANDTRIPERTRKGLTANEYVSGTCVPLTYGGELLGSFNLIYPRGAELLDAERGMLEALGNNLGVAMAQRLSFQRELELERQARRAQQLESLGVLAGGIAHDFNNLLMGILGSVELARLDALDAGQTVVVETLDDAVLAGARAEKLVDQLLTFSRGGAPNLEITENLPELLREVSSFASRGTSVRCDVHVDGELGAVEVDPGQIGQVIQNLVLNACQASPSGAVVEVRAQRRRSAGGDTVSIEVVDHGRGIAPEDQQRIFEPFFTARPGGTGLGLAVCHSIVQRHGGRLTVASTLGEGTAFTVELPGSEGRGAGGRGAGQLMSEFSGRALLMDDDAQVRQVVERQLRRLGFEVDVVNDGEAALEAARTAAREGRPFRVALLDLTVVGGLGGAEIVDEFESVSPTTKRVVASGYVDRELGNWHARLDKPYRIAVLSETLAAVLD